MRFKDFLREARYRTDISVEKAQEILQKNCTESDITKPMWRGSSKASEEAYVIQGELGTRSAAVAGNYYNILIDHFFPGDWPRRQKSLILTNNRGKGYARQYTKNREGGLYAVIPFDGTKIACCEAEDIWNTKFEIGKSKPRLMEDWAQLFEDCGLPDYSYEDFVNAIEETLNDFEDEHNDTLEAIFGNGKYLEQDLRQAFSPKNLNMELVEAGHVPENTGRECWIGGKCLALRHDIWQQIAKSDESIDKDHDY